VLLRALLLTGALAFAAGIARVGTLDAGVIPGHRLNLTFGTVASLLASPGTINFQANNPDLVMVAASSPATVTWVVTGGHAASQWNLAVQSGSSSITGCPTVPLSAVRVTCASASVSGGAGTGSCSGAFDLSTSPQQIAAGQQGDGNNNYSVSINFALAESWRYVANPSCTFTLTYSVNAQ
jgi:hypothetical protein